MITQEVNENDIQFDENDKTLYKKVQLSMSEAGLTEYLINLITHHEDPKVIGSSRTDLDGPDTSMSFEEFKSREKIKYQ